MDSDNTSHIPTVSVLIPAHNEAGTILALLRQVLAQTETGFHIEKIVVYSDGSNDGTASQAKRAGDPRIIVRAIEERKGLAAALNALLEETTSDAAIILNADISIPDRNMLANLVGPIVRGQADLTAALIKELPTRSWTASVLKVGMDWKRDIFLSWRGGNNFFTCFGPARAFSRRFYSTLRFPFGASDDAYSYLSCLQKQFIFRSTPHAVAYYQLPERLYDHINQSMRHQVGIHHLTTIFTPTVIQHETALPRLPMVLSAFNCFADQPVRFVAYTALTLVLAGMRPFWKMPDVHTWRVATSSKPIISL